MRRVALPLLTALALAGAARADEVRAFAEAGTPAGPRYEHQRIVITLRVGFDRDFFATNVVRTFRREMDVPLRVSAPWFDGDDALTLLAREVAPGADDGRPWHTFALNDDVVTGLRVADRVVGERIFTVLEVTRVFVATKPGWCEASGPVVEYAWATRFDETFLGDPTPRDRREARVEGDGAPFQILAIPAEGRPPGWGGAVGRFSVRAEAEPREVAAGATLRLTLRIDGDGNLADFDAPRLADLPGFHVYGRLDRTTGDVRTIGYDLAPIDASVTEIPAIELPHFDPSPPAGYRISRTSPIAIAVTGDGVERAPAAERTEAGESSSTWPWIVGGAIVAAVLLGLVVARRRAAAAVADPAEQAARAAADALRAGLESPADGLADAYADYLATRLGTSRAAVISPQLPSRLRSAGVAPELAARAAHLCERLVAARYGGADAADEAEAVRSVVDDLEATFTTPSR